MATVTANGKYNYTDVYNGKTLGEWVNLNHRENCRVNGWASTQLRAGAFGFDNIACSLVYFFEQYKTLQDDTSLASAVHNGWIENYLYWRDNKPWLGAGKNVYFKAAKPIGDKQRDMCATTPFADLPQEEKDKDMVFVSFMKLSMATFTCQCKKEEGETGICFSYTKNGYCCRVCYCREEKNKKFGWCSAGGGGIPGCEH